MPMHTTNQTDMLTRVSSDCARMEGTVPTRAGTVAALQYELISRAPYGLTSDDILWTVERLRRGIQDTPEARADFFSRPRACLRASPLVKSFGWGLHHDSQSRVALVGRESERYRELDADPAVAKANGMRSKRA